VLLLDIGAASTAARDLPDLLIFVAGWQMAINLRPRR